jgi:hypothetical protein
VQERRDVPPAATAGVWHVETGSDSAVLKVIHPNQSGDPRWPAALEPEHPYYWRREAIAYSSGLLERLVGLRAPACRGVFDRPGGSVALWLEEVPEPPPWTPERLASVAHGLGRSQAALAEPEEPWLARGWLRLYLELHDAPDPEREEVLARLEALPRTVVHNDPHPGNVLAGNVLIDWAYVGVGQPALDAGVLVADGVADGAFAEELADEVADAVWEAYTDGLGWASDELRWAFLRGTALRLSWLSRDRPWCVAAAAMLDRWRQLASEL